LDKQAGVGYGLWLYPDNAQRNIFNPEGDIAFPSLGLTFNIFVMSGSQSKEASYVI